MVEKERLLAALDESPYGFLALASGGRPYCVPLNFVRRDNTILFHSAIAGRKLDYIAASSTVSFVAVPYARYIKGQLDFEYLSVYIEGLARIVGDREEKRRAYSLLMAKYEGDPGFREVPDSCLDGSVIVSIDICRITGKEHRPEPGVVHPQNS